MSQGTYTQPQVSSQANPGQPAISCNNTFRKQGSKMSVIKVQLLYHCQTSCFLLQSDLMIIFYIS